MNRLFIGFSLAKRGLESQWDVSGMGNSRRDSPKQQRLVCESLGNERTFELSIFVGLPPARQEWDFSM